MNKKLAVLSVACTILIVLGGVNSNLLYSTSYLQTKAGYEFAISSAVDWWDCNWSYYKKIIIDHTKVQADQTNFPVLIYRSADAELTAYAQSDGGDIIFIDSANVSQYAHEIEAYNSSTGELTAWVKVASLSSTVDTILYMYYGNPTCSNQQNITVTWDGNHRMVQHLNESSGTLYDSTSYGNNGTNNGALYNDSAKIDGGYDFDGTDLINCGNDSSLNITTGITLEAWVKDPPWMKSESQVNSVRIVDKRDEEIPTFPGKQFTVERTIATDTPDDVIFVALFSPGVAFEDMSIGNDIVFAGSYQAGKPQSEEEQRVELLRSRLPDKLKSLETVTYSKPIRIEDEETIQVQFNIEEWYKLLSNEGRISYLVFSEDSFDFEGTTYWSCPLSLVDWLNPFSIFEGIIDFLTGSDSTDDYIDDATDLSDNSSLEETEDPLDDSAEGEMTEKRTLYSKTFTNDDGSFQEIIGIGPIHYPDENGQLKNINTTFIQSEDSEFNYEVIKGFYKTKLKKYLDSEKLVNYQHKDYNVELELLDLSWSNEQGEKQIISQPQNVEGAVKNNRIYYSGAYGAGIDVEFLYHPQYFGKYLVIDSYGSLPVQNFPGSNPFLEFNFKMTLSDNLDVYIDGEIWNGDDAITFDEVEFRDKNTGETQFYFKKPFSIDNLGNKEPVSLFLKKKGSELFISKRIDKNWLMQANYPLKADTEDTINLVGDLYDMYDNGGNHDDDTDVQIGRTGGARWDGYWAFNITAAIIGGTIDNVTFTGYVSTNDINVNPIMYGLQQEDCPALEGAAAPETYARTTASYAWNALNGGGTGNFTSGDISSIFNEWVSDYSHSNPSDSFGIVIDDSGAGNNREVFFYDSSHPAYISHTYLTINYTNSAPTQTGEIPANGSINVSITPQLNVTVDDPENKTLTADWYSNSSGSWALFATNSSIDTSGGAVNIIQTNSNFSDYGTTYWWSVNLTDGTYWTNNTYSFTTGYQPALSNPNPANGSTDQSLTPICNVTVSDADGGVVTVYFYENTTGSRVLQQTNSSVDVTTPANVTWNNYNNASQYGTTYWWSVNVTDGANWNNVTYYFTTSYLPGLSNPYPANGSSSIAPLPICNVTVSDQDGGTVDVYFYENTTGGWVLQQTNSSVDVSSPVNLIWNNYNNASSYATRYWWKVNVTDSSGLFIEEIYYFTTSYGDPPEQSGENPTDLSTDVSIATTTINVTVEDPEGSNMNWTIETRPNIGSNSGNDEGNGSKTCSVSGLTYGTTYTWYVNVTDGPNWNNETYKFTTSYQPVSSNPGPSNGSTGQSLTPICNVTVSDSDGGTVDVYFYENTTGGWILQQTNSSVDVSSPANVTWNKYTNASSRGTKYWWKVNVTDSSGLFIEEIYYFTTLKGDPATVALVNPSPNGTTNVGILPVCRIWANDTDGDTLTVYWYENSSGSYVLRATYDNNVTANTTTNYTFPQFSNYSTTYYWKVIVNDSFYNTTAFYYFTTEPIVTSVDSISPYEQSSSPLTINASTSNTLLDQISLYYRWSLNNWTNNWTTLTFDDFEAASGDPFTGTNYTDGGADCILYTGGTYAHQGSNAVDIQDNTGDSASFWHTNGIDVHTPKYASIRVDFWFYAVGMEAGNDFWVQYHDGSSWSIAATYVSGTDFVNDQFYHETVWINESDYTFPTDMRIKFTCDAFNPVDDVYIDEVYVNATASIGWTSWNNASNPDTSSPWNWSFDFPKTSGYYEFYSIGNKSGSPNETAPSSADAICKFNRLPTITNEEPSNGSTDVNPLTQMVNITVNDEDADQMTITWYSNSSGTWQIFGTNTSVGNGTYRQTNSNFSEPLTTYWWNISISDGLDTNNSGAFHFTTTVGIPVVTTNASTGVEETNATLHGYLQDDGGEPCIVRFEYGTDTTYGTNTTNQTKSTGNEFSTEITGLTQGQLYHYRAYTNNTLYDGTGADMTLLTKPLAPTGLNAQTNSSTVIYLNWTKGTGANNTYIERNASGQTVWTRGAGIVIYNGTGINYEDTGLSEGTTYYYQAWSYTNWTYDSTTLHQWSDANDSATNKTDTLPTITNEEPSNGSTDISLTPLMNITVNDADGDTMTITWYSNSSGTWQIFGTNTSVGNGTYKQANSNFSGYNTTYWWNVSVSDGLDTNNSGIFHFTTTVGPVIVTTNTSTGVEETNATLWGYLQDDGNDSTTCGFWWDTDSGAPYAINQSVGAISKESEFSYNATSLTPGQLYYFKAWASNSKGFNETSKELTFLTKPQPPTGLNAKTNSSTVIYLNWTKGIGANNTYIERNASGQTVWARGTGTMIYNGTGINYEDTGLSEGTTYYYQAWSYTNWTYDSTTLDQWSDTNATASSTSNALPSVTNELPNNGSSGINLNPTLSIQVNDSEGQKMNITWYWGTDSSCPNFIGINSSIDNGTYYMSNDANFSSNNKTYYWKVIVNDGNGGWTNETYHFTTIGENKKIVSKGYDTYSLEINPSGNTFYGYINSDKIVQASIDTNWHYVVMTYDGSNLRLYKDGALADTTGYVGTIDFNAENVTLGENLTGTLDEARISLGARDGNWINTTYQNTNDPESFATFGSQVGVLSTWSYRKQISINASMVDNDLVNFPVLIDTTDTDLRDNALANGNDILFIPSSVSWTNGSCSQRYAHEVEKYVSSTGELVAWVNVTSVSSSSDTTLYMYYGNALCGENKENREGVWNSNYVMVQHLNESSGTLYDSTSYGNNGTNVDDNATYNPSAKIDGGYDFDGTGDYIDVADDSSLNFTSNMTVSCWVRANGAPSQWDAILVKDDDDGWDDGYGIWYESNSEVRFYVGNDYSTQYANKTGVTTTDWNYVVGTCDGTTIKLYVNGVKGTDDNGAPTAVAGSLEIGRGQDNSWILNGSMDEVQISNVVRNISWINASYKNVNDSSNFTIFGSQEAWNYVPVLSNEQPSNSATGVSLWPSCNITVSDANGGSVDVYFYENTTGSWKLQQTNGSVLVTSPVTVRWDNYSNASAGSTKYWWSVNCTDGTDWTNETYNFTTAASPFIYIFTGQEYTKVSDFIPEATSKEKEYTSSVNVSETSVAAGIVRLKITEELDETTYLDRIYLLVDGTKIVELDSISDADLTLLKDSDDRYLIMNQGDKHFLTFTIPESHSTLHFVAEGHYVEHNRSYDQLPPECITWGWYVRH